VLLGRVRPVLPLEIRDGKSQPFGAKKSINLRVVQNGDQGGLGYFVMGNEELTLVFKIAAQVMSTVISEQAVYTHSYDKGN